ncbi:MAG: hypothetical protein M1817_004018 [Caeruleum heppii]|nr:MAG: hypothetical protein M1817_004018 [Caeruleum heppii]
MEPSSAPLADYFWIAGVDSLSYGPQCQVDPNTGERSSGTFSAPVDPVIDENTPLETHDAHPHSSSDASAPESSLDRHGSFHRLSKLSDEARKSIQSVTIEGSGTASNRSSVTIKPNHVNGSGTNEFDFDQALVKFASERDSFLDELSFTAGTIVHNRPMHPKAQRIMHESTNGVNKSSGGSIRRRISFRDLNSMRRQPSLARNASVRTSKRLSNYNSVIPVPQPIGISGNMHPLKRRFEPVLLDRYPPKGIIEETNRRGAFPDYVPMFAFPNDINIVSADEQPASTWHGFAMTTGDSSRLYGISVIVWMPLNPNAAAEIERQCEDWRRDNMTNEERELANSLGERLATERAKLSELLARLPMAPSGSEAREELEEHISETEEKIGLMTDLLRPVRHGAAAKIDGLTDGETGLWIPRAYGILGRDASLTSFWKEWLRAVIVPMMHGAVLRVPPSSPKVGMWQPLERYVVNLCAEALSPVSSKTQVEIAIRELRLFARKEAINEIPGSRNTDLYALFRALSISNILCLFEFALSESRIILLSSHTAMLHLASRALTSILYPMNWSCIFIPVLPARLLSALEAPCPYIVGIERRYDKIELPEDDFVFVDLDKDRIESTDNPTSLPRQQRRKLVSLLQLAAPHHNRYGVPVGPPPYAVETYPHHAFSSENPSIFSPNAPRTTLAKYASLNSTSFGESDSPSDTTSLVFNAFTHSRLDQGRSHERPSTGAASKGSSPPSPKLSPTSSQFPPLPMTPVSRNDSGYALTTTLREKRSGHFDGSSRRSSSYGFERAPTLRRPSIPFSHHSSSLSTSTMSGDNQSSYRYAPSTYAQSTMAASTAKAREQRACQICDDKAEEEMFQCTGCQLSCHRRCAEGVSLVCPAAFHPDQVLAAFVRCFASLFYTYRKYLVPAAGDQKKAGKLYSFNMDGFLKSMPRENTEYMQMMRQTQGQYALSFLDDLLLKRVFAPGFNEFIHERETKKPSDPAIILFDQIILAKKNRGKTSLLSKSKTSFLQDSADHLWRSAAATPPSSRFPGDYRQVTSRIPAKLDPALMKEPRVIQGAPRITTTKTRRKPIPSMLGLSNVTIG